MTGDFPTPERQDPLQALESVARIRPDEQTTLRAVQRALAAIPRQSEKDRATRWNALIMRSSLAAAILMVLVSVSWLAMGGSRAVAAPTWADLARQTQGIDKIYIDGRVYQGAKLLQRQEIWIKSPGVIRSREYGIVDGKMIPTECSIATPDAAVRWDERTKLGEYTSTNNRFMTQSGVAGTIEAILGISLLADQPKPDIKINGEQVIFEPVEEKHPQDAHLRGFRLKNQNPTAPALIQPFSSLIYWFAERSNLLRRITMTMGDGNEAQLGDWVVDFKPAVPPGWFDVTLPAGCTDVTAGLAVRLPPEVREVYERVVAARKRFGDYRAVIWRDGTGGWPSFRESMRGAQWRCDIIDWVVMHGAFRGRNEPGYIKVQPTDPFEKLWAQVNRPDYEPTMSAMTWRDQFAILHYKLAGPGPRVSAQLHAVIKDGYEKSFAPSLRMTAWPEWMWWENLEPHGWDLRNAPFRWRLGRSDPDHPERVEVVGERTAGFWTLVRYTLDRDKDWLCVRQEWTTNSQDRIAWEITSFNRTPDGFWYPGKMTFGNNHYEYAVERGAADEVFFEYPKGMPQPTDPFAELTSRVDQAASAPTEAPPIATGQ